MKISILYYSLTGHTREMAEVIAEGVRTVPGCEVKLFPLDAIDKEFLAASSAVFFGTPTYLASTCWQWKKWFDEPAPCSLGGKLGAVFATANFAQGGADIAIQTLLTHMLVKGMLVYSGAEPAGSPTSTSAPLRSRKISRRASPCSASSAKGWPARQKRFSPGWRSRKAEQCILAILQKDRLCPAASSGAAGFPLKSDPAGFPRAKGASSPDDILRRFSTADTFEPPGGEGPTASGKLTGD